MSFDNETMKAKIAKLLAKAEGTTNEAERETYTAKATKLMVELGIEAAELQAAGQQAEQIIDVARDFRGIYSPAMIQFTHAASKGFGDLKMLQMRLGQRHRRALIIGHQSDVRMFMLLLDSLEKQAMSALKEWKRETKEDFYWMGTEEKFVEARSFLLGYGTTVARRLRENRRQTVEQATVSTGAELVLASKQAKVNEWTQEHHKPKKTRGGMRDYGYTGALAGSAAGERADIGNTRIGDRKGIR